MKKIIADYRRAHAGLILWRLSVTAVSALVFRLTGLLTKENLWMLSAVFLLVMLGITGKAAADVLIREPARFRKEMSGLPEETREAIERDYPSAKTLGKRYFLPEHIIFYSGGRIVLLKYTDILEAAPSGGDLCLGIRGDTYITMPVTGRESPAIIYAVLRGKNPGINGKNTERNRTS